MDYIDKLSEYVKKRRIDAGYTLNKFCFEAEIETSTLSRYETKKRKLSLDTLIKIVAVYKQSLAEFLADFEEYDKKNS